MDFLFRILSKPGLNFLYFVADYLLFPLIYHIIRYRRKIVIKNLRNAFPNLNANEYRQLEKKIYHQFCNVFAEIIYSYRITISELKERVHFTGVEKLVELNLKYKSSIIMLGHMGCWEWMCSIHHHVKDQGITECSVYRKQKNESVNQLMEKLREKVGGICADKNKILRTIISRRKENLITIYGMVADQKPSPNNMHFWTTFLNQPTAFLDGSDILARKFDYPVFYFYITSPKRGYYDVDTILLSENSKDAAEYEIVSKYSKILEKNILEQPQLWLWTHNRWKWTPNDVPENTRTNLKD